MEERTLSKEAQQLQYLLEQENRRQQQQNILSSAAKAQSSNSYPENIPNLNEITSWMNYQKSVEEQLEEQVHFYQDALENLKMKSEEITNENARLYDQMRQNVVKENDYLTSEDEERQQNLLRKPKERLLQRKGEKQSLHTMEVERDDVFQSTMKDVPFNMVQMKKIYEMKTKHLEGLLKNSKVVVDEQHEEITSLKNEIRMYKTPVRENNDLIMASFGNSNQKDNSKLLGLLRKEKEDLIESNKKLNMLLIDSKKREKEACEKVKSSCDFVHQANLEKQEIAVSLKQTQEDLNTMKISYAKMTESKHQEKSKEIKRIQEENKLNVDKLHGKIEDASVTINALEVQMEKLTREKTALKAEVEREKIHSDKKQSESSKFIEKSRNDLLEAFKSKTLIEQEYQQFKLDSQQKEKRKQQEINQLKIELKETHHRNQLIEESLHEHQRDLLDTTNKLNQTKQKLQTESLQHNMMVSKYEDNMKTLTYGFQQKENQFALIIQETNKQHASSKEELGKLLEAQTKLVNNYKEECQSLTTALQKEKTQNEANKLNNDREEMKLLLAEADRRIVEQNNEIALLEKQVANFHVVEQDLQEQVMILMNKQNSILRDRHLLTKEIEMLRNQVKKR